MSDIGATSEYKLNSVYHMPNLLLSIEGLDELSVVASIKHNLSFSGKPSELLLSKRTIKNFLPASRMNV
jgi:hypothetical protein